MRNPVTGIKNAISLQACKRYKFASLHKFTDLVSMFMSPQQL